MTIAVGTPAPDFTTNDQHGNPVTLSDLRGKPVLLNFFPFAFSGLCTDEICTVRDDAAFFADADVQVLGMSCDPMYTLTAWSDANGIGYPLLTDFWPHGAISEAYGAFDAAAGCTNRVSVLIDADGNIADVLETANRGVVRTHDDYATALKQLG